MSDPSISKTNRWLIVGMGTLLQLCLGSVYAWSYFQKPLVDTYGWSNTQVAWTFSFAIGFLGISAALGGFLLPKFGPRKLAVTGSLLFSASYLLASLALHLKSLPLLWAGYGMVGGIGLGLSYVTPVATAAKWFPDKKGLATGIVVMGFGLGALLMSKIIAPALDHAFPHQLPSVFAGIGVILGMIGVFASAFLSNPRVITVAAPSPSNARSFLFSKSFVLIWLIFFCNIVAGIAMISFQSPLLQDLWKSYKPAVSPTALAAYGATLIAVSSVFNGLGRFLWGGMSDRMGQLNTFRLMLSTQALAFIALMFTRDPWLFAAIICYILLCYGGGFGVMPSFILNTFGPDKMAILYGCSLTAWSAGGVVGPQVVAYLKDRDGSHASLHTFGLGAGLLTLGFILSLLCRDKGTLLK